jgi:hypothetical protein
VNQIGDPGDGFCDASCTLRDAVTTANNRHPSKDTIGFDPGVFSTPQTIFLTQGQLNITDSVKIKGPGARLLSISGNKASRVFYVGDVVTTTLDSMTIRDGYAGNGGGIYNTGILIVMGSTVSGNNVPPYYDDCGNYYGGTGGGIFNDGGAATIDNSIISGNFSSGDGGGITTNGTLTVNASTISGNIATADGGGIRAGGRTTVAKSTISNNTASDLGTGISGSVEILTGSTISGNHCPSSYICSGDGISGHIGTLNNTIVAGNGGGYYGHRGDISGTIETASHNLISESTSSGGIQNGINGNLVGVNPLLGPLQNNGGSTMTHALLAGSPAINAGDNVFAIGPTDQRGAGFSRILAGTVDIGAFESASPPTVFVSGRVTTIDGSGVRGALVSLTDADGGRRTVLTSPLGYYLFDSVMPGQLFTLTVQSRRYRFSTNQVQTNQALNNLDLVAIE